MTPRDLIRKTAARLRLAGVPDPEYDSALLLSHLTGRAPLPLRLDTDSVLEDDTVACFQELCERRIRREPLQYILEETSFCGFVFHVDSRVLIPRPETELLCEWALEILSGCRQPKVLDLCCGSGCIGISLKLLKSDAFVWASDISEEALDVAKLNASRLNADIRLVRSDLFAALKGDAFDLIVSNPPYIPSRECSSLQPEVLAEPAGALDGGDDGLTFYRRICSEAANHLHPGGFLLMELGDGLSGQVTSIMRSCGFSSVGIRNDYRSMPRMIGGVFA